MKSRNIVAAYGSLLALVLVAETALADAVWQPPTCPPGKIRRGVAECVDPPAKKVPPPADAAVASVDAAAVVAPPLPDPAPPIASANPVTSGVPAIGPAPSTPEIAAPIKAGSEKSAWGCDVAPGPGCGCTTAQTRGGALAFGVAAAGALVVRLRGRRRRQ